MQLQRLWVDSLNRPEGVHAKFKLLKEPPRGIRVQCKGVSAQRAHHKELVVKHKVEASQGDLVTEKSLLDSLRLCKDLQSGKKLHNAAIESGLDSNLYIVSRLVDMYSKCGSMGEACKLFNSIPSPNTILWNSLMLGYIRNKQHEEALDSFAQMSCEWNVVSISAAFMACAGLAAEEEAVLVDGKFVKRRCLERLSQIHGQANSAGDFVTSDAYVGTNLVDAYAKCGSMSNAQKVFDEMLVRNVVTWNTLIAGYAENGENDEALNVFSAMDCAPNAQVFVTALMACGNGKNRLLKRGILIHEQASKAGYLGSSDMHVWNALISMYAKCESIVCARKVFNDMTNKNIVTWNAIMQGYVNNGDNKQALDLLTRLENDGQCIPDERSYIVALNACGNIMALERGKQLHATIQKKGLVEKHMFLTTSLIDFYGKCGQMDDAQQVFNLLVVKKVSDWNALLMGYSQQGEVERVFLLVERMKQTRIQPNHITFLAILTACNYAGLLDEGKEVFLEMKYSISVIPTIEHYTCMVNMFGWANQLSDAALLIKTMPFEANEVIWNALLVGCRKWKNIEIGKLAFESIIALNVKHGIAYVMMANIYESVGMLKERDKVLEKKDSECAYKVLGQSWWTDKIGLVHNFVVGGKNHPQVKAKLNELIMKMKKHGYIQNRKVKMDDKKDVLCVHSEKLAIGFALLNTEPGETIRLVNNLRPCDDCHRTMALISKIEEREIVCRYGRRLHVFKDGKCSCGDY